MPLVAGVDLSTQSTTVEVRDLGTGAVVARGRAPHPPTTPPRSEQDPAEWWTAFRAAWAAADAPAVAAVSVAGQQHGMVALDSDDAVIRPAKLWNDTESAPDAGWLRAQLGDDAAWADAVGSVPLAAFTITKLSWLHRSEPEHWARLAHVLLPHDWLTLQLCGERVTDRGDASGTGYWSPATGEYRWDVLRIVDRDRDWTDVVPRVLDPREAAGTWNGAVVGPGTGDNMAAAVGLGLAEGEAMVSIGTSGTLSVRSRVPTSDPSGAVAGFADATGAFLPLVCTLNGAKVLDAVARLLGVDHRRLDELAAAAPPGGPVLVPYLDGERTPDRPAATGWLGGLRSDVTREQLARAAVDGVACGLLDGLDALRRHAVVERIVLTGGASASEVLRGVLAALAGVPVVHTTQPDAVAAGACVQAAATLLGMDLPEVANQWGLGAADPVAPRTDVADDLRARYAAARDLVAGG